MPYHRKPSQNILSGCREFNPTTFSGYEFNRQSFHGECLHQRSLLKDKDYRYFYRTPQSPITCLVDDVTSKVIRTFAGFTASRSDTCLHYLGRSEAGRAYSTRFRSGDLPHASGSLALHSPPLTPGCTSYKEHVPHGTLHVPPSYPGISPYEDKGLEPSLHPP